MEISNKFSRKEARVLVWPDNTVYEANNREQVEYIVNLRGKPHLYMNNFNTWQEMEDAGKNYRYLVSGLPGAANAERPTDESIDWFWEKQLVDEHFVKDIKEIVAKYDDLLPDSLTKYAVKL